MVTKGESRGRINQELRISSHKLLYIKQINNQTLLYKHKELYSIILEKPIMEKNIYIYNLNHFAIHQKPTPCKSTILKFKEKKKIPACLCFSQLLLLWVRTCRKFSLSSHPPHKFPRGKSPKQKLCVHRMLIIQPQSVSEVNFSRQKYPVYRKGNQPRLESAAHASFLYNSFLLHAPFTLENTQSQISPPAPLPKCSAAALTESTHSPGCVLPELLLFTQSHLINGNLKRSLDVPGV